MIRTPELGAGNVHRVGAGAFFLGAFVLASAIACGRGGQEGCVEGSVALADYVLHQSSNVTTRNVSIPESIGLERLSHGWRIVAPSGREAGFAEIGGREAQIEFFSADGSVQALELELGLTLTAAAPGGERRGVKVYLNGRRVARLKVDPAWTIHRLDLKSGIVRTGPNTLTLEPGVGAGALRDRLRPTIRLRRLRLLSGSDRRQRAGHRDHIRVQPSAGAHPRIVVMPTDGFLDLVLRLPRSAHLAGEVSLSASPDTSSEPVVTSVRLLDEAGTDEELFLRHLRTTATPHNLTVDLERWAGQIVRLRFAAMGAVNSLVLWRDVCVQGVSTDTEPTPGPLLSRAPVVAQGGLGRPDVLVVLLDAARADAFSPFGGHHITPATERLAASGTVFLEAIAPSSSTGQSLPAIFTGLFPDTVGAGAWGSVLPAEIGTLAEMMTDAGYRTVLWSQHPIYRIQPSLVRGFEAYDPPSPDSTLPDADDLLSSTRPTFAFVHLVPPHQPYTPPVPYRGAYSAWYEGSISTEEAALGRPANRQELPSEDLRYIRDRYLENVAYADHLLGRLLSELDERDRYRDALIVLLSDHGEAFYEHGRFLHSRDVHRESLRVPFVLKWPQSAKSFRSTVREPVSLIDLLPTLVDGLGLASESEGYQGRSLLPLARGNSPASHAIYAFTRGRLDQDLSPRPQLMFQHGGWRILHRPIPDESQLYRVESDAEEVDDLSRWLPMRTLLLRQAVLMQWAWNRQLIEGAPSTVDELDSEQRRQLEALGYLE